ncbi:hypothetical protein V3N99_08690 [Dermatophilaceae bacterium Soc4.6]
MEAELRAAYPDLRVRRRRAERSWIHVYTATVAVPGYPSRVVTAEFDRRLASHPEVYADGPTESPHRFDGRGGTRLCVWYHSDPPERRWVPDDGLLRLFGMVQTHLLKEAWWRESGQWVGDEAPHPARPDQCRLNQARPDHTKGDTL